MNLARSMFRGLWRMLTNDKTKYAAIHMTRIFFKKKDVTKKKEIKIGMHKTPKKISCRK